YFAIAKFPGYGRLSQLDRREIKIGARVASDEYAKDDPRDFALWKRADPIDEQVGAAWDAPFGRGRPGWHLECSAMSLEQIGKCCRAETLDIHAGGVDLIFPHHEDEIAQSEAATGKPFARFWLHGEFLNVGGTKMSKRFGNFLTARDLREQGVDAAAVRLLFWQTHYRKALDFSDEALAARAPGAAVALGVLDRAMAVLDVLPTPKALDPAFVRWVEEWIAARERARKSKDFKEADRIRAELKTKHVEIEDTPTGTKWR